MRRTNDLCSIYCLFLVDGAGDRYFKIGLTWNGSKARIAGMQTGNPFEIFLHSEIRVINPKIVEKDIHAELSIYNVRGEWFYFGEDEYKIKECFDRYDAWKIIERSQLLPHG